MTTTMSSKPITTHEAQIATATIEVKTVTLNAKQMTLSVFRQLQEEPMINPKTGDLVGQPWGIVRYHWNECPKEEHEHIVWQKGSELRRYTMRERDWSRFTKEEHAPAVHALRSMLALRLAMDYRVEGCVISTDRVDVRVWGHFLCFDNRYAINGAVGILFGLDNAHPALPEEVEKIKEVLIKGLRFQPDRLTIFLGEAGYTLTPESVLADTGTALLEECISVLEHASEKASNRYRYQQELASLLPQLFIAV